MSFLPTDVKELKTYDEVFAAWGELFTVPDPKDEDDPDAKETGAVLFAENSRVAITAEAIYVKLRKPVRAGANLELTDVLRIIEPSVSDIRLTDKYKGEMEKAICLLGTICTIPQAEINKMGGSDFKLVGLVIGCFF